MGSSTTDVAKMLIPIVLVLMLAGCSIGADDEAPIATSQPESTVSATQEIIVTFPPMIGSPVGSPATSGSPAGPDIVVTFGQTEPMCQIDPDGYLQIGQYREALLCVVDIFPWPSDKKPDVAMIDDMFARDTIEKNQQFQDGFQHGTMASYNACAWIETWYDAYLEGDQAMQDLALVYLQEFLPRPWEKNPNIPSEIYDETVSRQYQQMAEGAALGDPTAIVEFMNNSRCGDFAWNAA